jgi:hypothetical protein
MAVAATLLLGDQLGGGIRGNSFPSEFAAFAVPAICAFLPQIPEPDVVVPLGARLGPSASGVDLDPVKDLVLGTECQFNQIRRRDGNPFGCADVCPARLAQFLTCW